MGKFDRSARKAQTRARLLEAAARVYARRGFNGATLEEVASEAGFTKGAVYAHFGSKENLLLALDGGAPRRADRRAAGAVRPRARTWERPLAGSERWMEGLEQDPDRFRLFVELWAQAQRDERLRVRLAEALAQLRSTFAGFAAASAADAGLEPPPRPRAVRQRDDGARPRPWRCSSSPTPGTVPPSLLGATISILIRAMETSAEARELIAELAPAREGATGV